MPSQPDLAGVLENRQAAVVRQVLVQADAGPALPQDAGQRRLADLDRLAPQVRAVQLQQVEGVEEGCGLVAPPAEDIEAGRAPARRSSTTSPSIRQDRTLRWFTASTTSGKRSDQSLPRRVISRMPTESLRAIRR